MTKRSWRICAVVMGFGLVLLTMLLVGRVDSLQSRQQQLDTMGFHILSEPRDLKTFELTQQDGGPFGLNELKGNWTLVFFGYTYCPDVCPTTLARLVSMKRMLSADAGLLADTRFVMVSVDPARDTPERLEEYLAYFDPGFVGITGTIERLEAFAAQLSSVFIVNPSSDPNDYQVDHSSHILLIDPAGRFVGFFRLPHDPENLAQAYRVVRG